MKNRPILLGFLVGSAVILVFFAVAMMLLTSFSSNFPSSIMGSDGIGVVNITSTINESRLILDQLDRYHHDDSIAAILLRIDSPGGAVGPSQEIHREIMKIRNDKVVVASLGSTAASGGYYVACAANKFINVRRLYETIGMSSDVVKSGRFKDMGAWSRDLTTEERALLQNVVDDVQKQFIEAIVDGRDIDRESILSIADGRIFTGAQAMSYGLVDKLGNYNDSIDYAAELAGIEGKPRIVRQKERRISVWDIVLDDLLGQFAGKLQNAMELRDFRLR